MIADIDFYVFNGAKKSHSCVICLAGRSGCGGRLAAHYQHTIWLLLVRLETLGIVSWFSARKLYMHAKLLAEVSTKHRVNPMVIL